MIMTREEIKKAAKDYALQDIRTTGIYARAKLIEGFEIGAQWRINSVWHDTETEFPESGRDMLVLFRGGGCEITDSGTRFDLWRAVSLWAYVSDLIPNSKEDER